MGKLKIWQIPRSDKTDRCFNCLNKIKENQYHRPVERQNSIYRYTKECSLCYRLRQNKLNNEINKSVRSSQQKETSTTLE